MRDTEREERHRQREKQAPCGEPNAELTPRTLESRPESKADTQSLGHLVSLIQHILNAYYVQRYLRIYLL